MELSGGDNDLTLQCRLKSPNEVFSGTMGDRWKPRNTELGNGKEISKLKHGVGIVQGKENVITDYVSSCSYVKLEVGDL